VLTFAALYSKGEKRGNKKEKKKEEKGEGKKKRGGKGGAGPDFQRRNQSGTRNGPTCVLATTSGPTGRATRFWQSARLEPAQNQCRQR